MPQPKRTTVTAGFIPLIDAAPLVVAARCGFAEAVGIDLRLSRETSWATIRDRLAVGHLDMAHALAPLPIAANLGLGPLDSAMLVPLSLGTGGNTVTLARHHWDRLQVAGAEPDLEPTNKLAALRELVAERAEAGAPKLVFGIVHPHSAHRYQLAYWLASGGLIPGRDVSLLVLPPALMPSALAAGRVDGFCAGEPWGSVALDEGAGVIVTTNAHIWPGSPEKVIAVTKGWADANSAAMLALVRALHAACLWCDAPENRADLAALLADEACVDQPVDVVARSLARSIVAPNGETTVVDGFLRFSEHAATFPWVSHAFWFAAQMARWGEITLTDAIKVQVRATWRPDLTRQALAPLGVDLPAANAKVEGAMSVAQPVGSSRGRLKLLPDGFFDGRVFDLEQIETYVTQLKSADRGA